MSLPIDTTGSKNGTQGAGSAASYGKRHTMKAILNIVEQGEDTDGKPLVTYIEREEWQESLVDEARQEAMKGPESYQDWFKSLSSMRRGYLVDCGEHEKLKRAAADHAERG